MARILIGTSGFSYKEWKGGFYPEDLPSKKYLSYYATHFKTTEINNTFYRLPTTNLTEGWYREVPEDFSFTLKLTQKITHMKKLRNVEEEMNVFLQAAEALKQKMGPILVQLPPYFRKDLDALQDFLGTYSARGKLALEFRHDSWFNDEVYAILEKHGSALGVVEAEERDAIRKATGNFIYMRLRKGEYSKEELSDWAKWVRGQTIDIYCYLKHDEKAPVIAKQLIEMIEIVK